MEANPVARRHVDEDDGNAGAVIRALELVLARKVLEVGAV
jgi:hypothetical protein